MNAPEPPHSGPPAPRLTGTCFLEGKLLIYEMSNILHKPEVLSPTLIWWAEYPALLSNPETGTLGFSRSQLLWLFLKRGEGA